jgi:RNA polymerase sigma-70 factor (ECF subfamily)
MADAVPPLDADLDRWIAAFRGPLVGLIASWGASWRQAEELGMDTFAEAWLARDRFRAPRATLETVGPWLRGIAFRLLQAARRRERRQPTALAHEPPAAAPDTGDERRDALRAAFAELRPELQQVLRMHYLEHATAREVAALLGITPKAVESRLYQARRALRALAERKRQKMAGGRT